MVVVDVLDQLIHVPHVPGPTPLPRADGDLLLEVIFVLSRVHGRARDVAIGIGGDVRHAIQQVGIGIVILRSGRGRVRSGGSDLQAFGWWPVVHHLCDLVGKLVLGRGH